MSTNQYRPSTSTGYGSYVTGRNAAFFDGEYRRYFLNRGGCLYTASTNQAAVVIDFKIPADEIIDSTLYDITSVNLKIYVTSLLLGSDTSSTPTSATQTNLRLMLRNAMTGNLDALHAQIPNTNSNESSIYNYGGTNYLASTSLSANVNQWNTLALTSSFYAQFLAAQEDGYISLILKRTAISASQAFYVALDGHADGTYRPILEVNYQAKQQPGIISSFDLADVNTLRYVDEIPVILDIRDSEADTQTVTIEGRAKMADDCEWGEYTPLSIQESNALAAPITGYVHNLTVNSIFRQGSIATTRRLKYYEDPEAEGGIYWEGETLVIPGETQDFADTLYTGKDLKPNTVYRMGLVHDGGGAGNPARLQIYQPEVPGFTNINTYLDTYDDGDPSTYVTFNSGPDGNDVVIIINGYSGSPYTRFTDIILREHTFDIEPWDVTLRAKLSDNDGISDYYSMPRTLVIDGRAPHSVAITDTAGSSDGVFQQSPNATFSYLYNVSAYPDDPPVIGYRWKVDESPNTELTTADAFTVNGTKEYTAPWDNRWYFHVATEGSNGILSPTSHYGFFYNIPADFNTASGVYCNSTQIFTDSTQWINYDLRPQFTWVRPDEDTNLLTYSLQVGIEGGVSHANGLYTPAFAIDWSVVPEAYSIDFRIYITDNVGIRYALKDTTISTANWEVYDSSNDTWVTIDSLANSVVPRTKIADGTQYRYNKVRYQIQVTDHVPDRVPLVMTIQLGYYDDNSTNYTWDQETQPKFLAFTPETYAYDDVFQMGYTVPNAQIMSMFVQLSQDNFISDISSYTTVQHYKSFVEVFKHHPEDALVCYFNSIPVTNEIDNRSGSASNATTQSNVRATGNTAMRFNGVGASLSFGDYYDPYLRPFGLAFWFNVNAPAGGSVPLVQKGGYSSTTPGFFVELTGTGALNIFVGDGTDTHEILITNNDYRDGEWYHVVLNYNKPNLEVYVDGTLRGSSNSPVNGNINSTSSFVMGNGLDGWIDDLTYRFEPFTKQEIRSMQNWTHEQLATGLEIPLTTIGVLGDGSFRTIRYVASRNTYLEPGNYKWRYKKTINGAQDGSFTTSASAVNLGAADSIPYTWDFDNPEIDEDNIAVPEFRPDDDLTYTGRAYFARFRVFDGFEYGNWTEMYKFRVNEKPVAPNNLFIQ